MRELTRRRYPPWTCSSSGFIDDNVFVECRLLLRGATPRGIWIDAGV